MGASIAFGGGDALNPTMGFFERKGGEGNEIPYADLAEPTPAPTSVKSAKITSAVETQASAGITAILASARTRLAEIEKQIVDMESLYIERDQLKSLLAAVPQT